MEGQWRGLSVGNTTVRGSGVNRARGEGPPSGNNTHTIIGAHWEGCRSMPTALQVVASSCSHCLHLIITTYRSCSHLSPPASTEWSNECLNTRQGFVLFAWGGQGWSSSTRGGGLGQGLPSLSKDRGQPGGEWSGSGRTGPNQHTTNEHHLNGNGNRMGINNLNYKITMWTNYALHPPQPPDKTSHRSICSCDQQQQITNERGNVWSTTCVGVNNK